MAASDKDGYLYVCRLGVDDDWVAVWGLMTEVTFRRRKMFCSCKVTFHRKNMDRLDEHSLLRICPKPLRHRNFVDSYVVESCGELLLVTLFRPCGLPPDDSTITFRVHRWEEKRAEEEEEEFVRVHDLGDRMLFIGRGAPGHGRERVPTMGFSPRIASIMCPPRGPGLVRRSHHLLLTGYGSSMSTKKMTSVPFFIRILFRRPLLQCGLLSAQIDYIIGRKRV